MIDPEPVSDIIAVWEDETSRSAFQYSAREFWVLNKYLKTPMSLRMMRNVDLSQLLDLSGKFLFIRTRLENSEEEKFDAMWQRCRQ